MNTIINKFQHRGGASTSLTSQGMMTPVGGFTSDMYAPITGRMQTISKTASSTIPKTSDPECEQFNRNKNLIRAFVFYYSAYFSSFFSRSSYLNLAILCIRC